MLQICEIFDSIQGEGIHVGRLATFMRFQGCNLSCAWCDTPKAQKMGMGTAMTEEALVQESFHPLVVLTGGEPLAQDMGMLAASLRMAGHEIHIETNGSLPLPTGLCGAVEFWTISPKREADVQAVRFIQMLLEKGANAQIKFVVRSRNEVECYEDTKWVRFFLQNVFPNPGRQTFPVVLQPDWSYAGGEGVEIRRGTEILRETYEKRYKQLAYTIKQRWPEWDVRLIPQTHKLLHLDRNCHKTI